MRLLDRSTVFAYCGTMLVSDPRAPVFQEECPEPNDEDCMRGFLAPDDRCIFFYIRNHTWRVPVAVYISDSAPVDFGLAERVVRFPLAVRGGELIVSGVLPNPDDPRRLQLESADYTLYWLGYNLDKRWPTDAQMHLDLEEYAALTDVERYDIILVRTPCVRIEILKGDDYLYGTQSA